MSWSGAHPTGDIVPDPNSTDGEYEEYPSCCSSAGGRHQRHRPVHSRDLLDPGRQLALPGGLADEPYQLDQYASTPGAAVVGEPSPLPSTTQEPYCQSTRPARGTPVRYWVPWVAADGTVYDGGAAGYCGEPPEATDGRRRPCPATRPTASPGSTAPGAPSSTCSTRPRTPRSAVPPAWPVRSSPSRSWGSAATPMCRRPRRQPIWPQCEAAGAVPPGTLADGSPPDFPYDLTVSGSLWWSPSNWRNRITVPLTFAPTPSSCPVVSSNNTVDVYGSELMLQATSQWEPYFCLGDDSRPSPSTTSARASPRRATRWRPAPPRPPSPATPSHWATANRSSMRRWRSPGSPSRSPSTARTAIPSPRSNSPHCSWPSC